MSDPLPVDTVTDPEIESLIQQWFEDNFQSLKLEGGHGLSPDVKAGALNQVLFYWRKLHAVAEKVTDTEVKLNLPGQKSPAGRAFGIEGVVDVVREEGRVTMYDIKTHDATVIRANRDDYARQLNVYAYIWQHLRGQPLDEMAVICTEYPAALRLAHQSGDERALAYELDRWEPLIPIDFDATAIDEAVQALGAVVDLIEDHRFAPPDVERLRQPAPGTHVRFATHVCRNCDARFSCTSYREYIRVSHGNFESSFRQYLEDFGDEPERDRRRLLAAAAADLAE